MSETGLILTIETSSRIGSAALACGDELLGEKVLSAPLKHSAEIFPAIFELLSQFGLKPNQIKQVYISGGPGSFTGLRIAATFAKTMHLATGVKIVSVDTLDVVAANVIASFCVLRSAFCVLARTLNEEPERVATIVDAKRGQFFVAVYEKSRSAFCVPRPACSTERRTQNAELKTWAKVVPDCLMRPEQFINEFAGRNKEIWLLGDGLLYYKERFQARGIRFFEQKYWSPRASKVYLLGRQMAARGEFADPLTLAPNYLRCPDVKIKNI